MSTPILILFDPSPPVYSTTMTYFVPLVKVIWFAPENVKATKSWAVVRVETSKLSEVAKAAPVGTEDVPKVPEWA